MIHIFLADDDILILNRLTEMIHTHPSEYEITGQATNGAICLELIETLHPDILLLDIDMPEKNGVEVTKEIFQRKLPVKVLILSNYDTFSFVRDAMRYGAYDYLLKHQLTEQLLFDKLSELTQLMKQEGVKTSQFSYFTTLAKQRYFSSLIHHGITAPAEHSHMVTQRDFDKNPHCLALMQITNFILVTHFSSGMNREKLIDSVLNLAISIFATLDNGLIIHLEYGCFGILFHSDNPYSETDLFSQATRCMRVLTANIQKLFNVSCLFEVSPAFSDFQLLPQIYQQTFCSLSRQNFSSSLPSAENGLNLLEEKNLMEALSSLDISRTRESLHQIFVRCQKDSSVLSQKLIHQILQLGFRFNQSQNTEFRNTPSQPQAIDFSHMSVEEIEKLLANYLCSLLQNVPGVGSRRYSEHIQKALSYIHEHFAEDFSLNDLAENLHVSPTHLSRLFRKELETSFIDYLVTYRIERAQQMLLHNNLDLKTISEKTGFHGYNYFLRAYKEKTGHTPSYDLKNHNI